ncbi:LuxR family transcriptional regulator [Dactylosporangium siamense]|uniref:Transcriptional regulator n=1 Tax=Dactylosporangium siamense TaxID=685454 RepID=A0A919PQH5_9ACTN|nr:transcriptional regulator [Dactylosporangium siamense]
MTLFGRDEQLAIVRSAVDRAGAGFQVMVLTGPAGIGKTALWESGVADAEAAGHAVLQTRACEAEARLSHGGLSDLLEHVGEDVLAGLAPPQRRAVDAALLRDDSGPVDSRALGAGFLAIVRALAAAGAVLIAVDDDQWLDAASIEAVMYAVRRLRNERVTVLLTRRRDWPDAPYGAEGLAPHLADLRVRVSTVEVPPLPPDAIQRLIDRPVPARLAGRVYDLSAGNPYFALEIAEALRRADQPVGPGDDLPVPSSLQALVSARLAAAAPGTRRAILVTALVSNPRVGLIRDVLTRDDAGGELEESVADGLLVIRGEHVRLAHPLIGAVARAEAPGAVRRHLHRILADLVVDAEERVRHRALGTLPPDAAIADELALVAEKTIHRGGPRAAAELAEQAWRFTPPADPGGDERLLAAADLHLQSGLVDAGAALLRPHVAALPPGPLRGRARLRLAQMSGVVVLTQPEYEAILADADPQLRAETLAYRVNCEVFEGFVPVSQGALWATEAIEVSEGLDPATRARVVSEAAFMDAMLGVDPAPRLALVGVDALPDLAWYDHRGRIDALRAMWRGEMASAQRLLGTLQRLARERGEEISTVVFTLHLFEAAIRVGDWIAAAGLRHDLGELDPAIVPAEVMHRVAAAVAAGTGDRPAATEALRWFDEVSGGQVTGPTFWHQMETRRVAGQAALFDGDADTAAALLSRVVADAHERDYRDPGVFPAAPDLVEALVKAGRPAEAQAVLDRLTETAQAQDHPWARAGAARARGILLTAATPADPKATTDPKATADEPAEVALVEAGDRYRALGLPFDEVRTIAALATLRRRQRRFREARTLLQDAAERFERLGAAGLARAARAEIGRFGGRQQERAATAGGLTATEQQVVDLVVAGCTNRQAADRLFISISAVEAHLTRVYAKLGVTSRTQLVRTQATAEQV